MSVTSLLRIPAVGELLEPLLPQDQIRLGLTLRAPPLTQRNHGGVGIAFDYALRFELERRHAHARTTPWIAEQVSGLPMVLGDNGADTFVLEPPGLGEASAMSRRWAKIVGEARAAYRVYKDLKAPTTSDMEAIARHALRLARVDVYYRAGYVDPEPERADAVDVRDVVQLLELAPCQELGSQSLLWLNPTFGLQSARVGGADVDMISGDRLIDFKSTKNPSPRQDLVQLVCYLILAQAERQRTPTFPEIRQVGVYYARHQHLWLLPAERFVANPEFEEVSRSYFDVADQVFSRHRRVPRLEVSQKTKRRPTKKARRAVKPRVPRKEGRPAITGRRKTGKKGKASRTKRRPRGRPRKT